jgi:hypothetical protein
MYERYYLLVDPEHVPNKLFDGLASDGVLWKYQGLAFDGFVEI